MPALCSDGVEPLDDWVSRLYARHPKKKNKALVGPALWVAVTRDPDPAAKFAEIDQAHEIACQNPDWRKDGGRFAPKLDEWIADEGYTAVRIPARPVEPDSPPPPPVIELTPEQLAAERAELQHAIYGDNR